MSTDMLENIRDGCQSHPSINRRQARYRIRYRFKKSQTEWKGELLSIQNMGKGLHEVFKAAANDISLALPILGESISEVPYFIPGPIRFVEVTRLS